MTASAGSHAADRDRLISNEREEDALAKRSLSDMAENHQDALPAGDNAHSPMVHERKCTDLFWLILYILFWVGMFYIFSIGARDGDPYRIVNGYDYLGQTCGRGDLDGRLYNFFPEPSNRGFSICVESCPTAQDASSSGFSSVVCKYGKTPASEADIPAAVLRSDCFNVYATVKAFNRCIPDFTEATNSQYAESFKNILNNSEEVAEQIMGKLNDHSAAIGIACGAALVLGFAYIYLLRFLALPIAWISIIGVDLVLLALTAASFIKLGWLDPSKLPGDVSIPFDVDSIQIEKSLLVALAVVFALLSVVALLLSLFMCRRITEATRLMGEASRAISQMVLLVLLPLATNVAFAVIIGYAVVGILFIGSAGTFNEQSGAYEWDKTIRYMMLYHVLGFFWAIKFVGSVTDLSASGAYATWYYSSDRTSLDRPLRRSVGRTFRYHLGTVAFGSLITAIVATIRVLFAYVAKKLRVVKEKAKIAAFLLSCIQCCLACFQRFLEFVNKNAYVITAVRGSSFCRSMKTAFALITRNIMRLATVNILSSVFLFLGKLFVAGAAAGIGILYETGRLSYRDADTAVVIVMFIAGYFIAGAFLEVYETGVDALVICYLLDLEDNKGVAQYAPKSLDKSLSGHSNADDVNVQL